MKRVLRRVADFQARLILAIFYYTLLTPFALAARFAGRSRAAGWQRRSDPEEEPLARAGRQY